MIPSACTARSLFLRAASLPDVRSCRNSCHVHPRSHRHRADRRHRAGGCDGRVFHRSTRECRRTDFCQGEGCRRRGRRWRRETLARVDPSLVVNVERGDGSAVVPGDTVLTIQGRAGSILTGERVALNFLQRLSGVATLTRRFVDAVAGHAGADSRHPQDHSRPARAGKSRCPGRRWAQSPHGSL